MIENRELTMDDYLAMLKRRYKLVLIPALIAPLIGYGISFFFPPKYTSRSLVAIEEQKVAETYVKPVITADIIQRVNAMRQQVLVPARLRAMLESRSLVKKGENIDDRIAEIQQNFSVEFQESEVSAAAKKKKSANSDEIAGFSPVYTSGSASEAELICAALTDALVAENLKSRQAVTSSTTNFLTKQLEEAKASLDDLDSKLTAFRKQYLGQLPEDADNNMKLLAGLNAQLDANTQTLNRAQQDKAYTESLLAQQLAAWKSSQGNTNPQTLQQQLAQVQSQLVTLQARYTDDHPDVVKAKNDIAEIKRKLKEMDEASANATDTGDKENASEPIEVRQIRLQVHQYGEAIAQATRDQKRLQDQIRIYQGRVALSPSVQEQWGQLNRDYKTAETNYTDLLAKKSQSTMQGDLELSLQGEQMRLAYPANLPESPSFPNRWLFAGGGLAAGLFVGMAIAMWLELRDKSIRNEQDVIAALELPMLVSVPWLVLDSNSNGNGGYGGRSKTVDTKREKVEV